MVVGFWYPSVVSSQIQGLIFCGVGGAAGGVG